MQKWAQKRILLYISLLAGKFQRLIQNNFGFYVTEKFFASGWVEQWVQYSHVL